MQAQTPAQGVLKMYDWGYSKLYQVMCECSDPDCTHTIDIEAEDSGSITVTIYTKTHTKFWSQTRWRHMWQLLTRGSAEFETRVFLTQQVALNYATMLHTAVQEVTAFKKARDTADA